MTCAKCGSGVVSPVDVPEPKDNGSFTEKWQCNVCDAQGYVSGDEAEMPQNWNRYGAAFETDMDGSKL